MEEGAEVSNFVSTKRLLVKNSTEGIRFNMKNILCTAIVFSFITCNTTSEIPSFPFRFGLKYGRINSDNLVYLSTEFIDYGSLMLEDGCLSVSYFTKE